MRRTALFYEYSQGKVPHNARGDSRDFDAAMVRCAASRVRWLFRYTPNRRGTVPKVFASILESTWRFKT